MSRVAVSSPVAGTGVFTISPPATNTDHTLTLPDAGGTLHTSESANDHASMPTVNGDPIVESGSNADGEWTRWADGTQQCIRRDNFNNYSIVTEGTSTGSARLVNANFPFPIAFITAPARSVVFHSSWSANTDSRTSDFSNWVNVRLQTVIAGSSDVMVANSGSFMLFASGRWK